MYFPFYHEGRNETFLRNERVSTALIHALSPLRSSLETSKNILKKWPQKESPHFSRLALFLERHFGLMDAYQRDHLETDDDDPTVLKNLLAQSQNKLMIIRNSSAAFDKGFALSPDESAKMVVEQQNTLCLVGVHPKTAVHYIPT
jgi:hypothetical protein